MTDTPGGRDYSLTGNPDAAGFRLEDWYVCPVPRKRLKELMRRSDTRALRDFSLFAAALACLGVLAWFSLGTWWAPPAFLAYGILYASGAESRFHECLHGTPFRTRRINEAFLVVLGFMSLKNPFQWRWSHSRHHTDTIIVGRDPEIAYPRPPDVTGMFLNILHLRSGTSELLRSLRQSLGGLSNDELDYIPEGQRHLVIRHSRLIIAFLAAIVAWCIAVQSIIPLLFFGLPTFYGSWVHSMLSAMQHAGLAEDMPDHRLSTRTVHLNPVLRFIYANMNYHIEHHMFPTVPFYSLPALHREIRHDCPDPYSGVFEAYREMIPALKRQLRDPRHFVRRKLPEGAAPPRPHVEAWDRAYSAA